MFSVWGGPGPQTQGEGAHLTRDQKHSASVIGRHWKSSNMQHASKRSPPEKIGTSSLCTRALALASLQCRPERGGDDHLSRWQRMTAAEEAPWEVRSSSDAGQVRLTHPHLAEHAAACGARASVIHRAAFPLDVARSRTPMRLESSAVPPAAARWRRSAASRPLGALYTEGARFTST